MDERINVRVSKDMHKFIEKYKIENKLEDISDAVREIIYEKKELNNSFLKRLNFLFFRN